MCAIRVKWKKSKKNQKMLTFPRIVIDFLSRKSTRRFDHHALGFGFFLGFLIGPLLFSPFQATGPCDRGQAEERILSDKNYSL